MLRVLNISCIQHQFQHPFGRRKSVKQGLCYMGTLFPIHTHATFISTTTDSIPFDLESQTGLSPTSSGMRNLLRSLGDVVFCLHLFLLLSRRT